MTLDTPTRFLIERRLAYEAGSYADDVPLLLDALDAAESRYAQLSALVDTWQRRFNLELQRALAAESELAETRAERDALEAENTAYEQALK